ncbi:hypothetical protein LINGRAHAP2_LOCUS23171 [Linum grandiflorum]
MERMVDFHGYVSKLSFLNHCLGSV